jgi:hypothetical protein
MYGAHSLLRYMVDRSFGDSGLRQFPNNIPKISQSAKLANSQSGVDEQSMTSQHQWLIFTTKLQLRGFKTLELQGFETLELWGLETFNLWGSRTSEDFTSAHSKTPKL